MNCKTSVSAALAMQLVSLVLCKGNKHPKAAIGDASHTKRAGVDVRTTTCYLTPQIVPRPSAGKLTVAE